MRSRRWINPAAPDCAMKSCGFTKNAIDPAHNAELILFASDPDLVDKGIGSKLLAV